MLPPRHVWHSLQEMDPSHLQITPRLLCLSPPFLQLRPLQLFLLATPMSSPIFKAATMHWAILASPRSSSMTLLYAPISVRRLLLASPSISISKETHQRAQMLLLVLTQSQSLRSNVYSGVLISPPQTQRTLANGVASSRSQSQARTAMSTRQ